MKKIQVLNTYNIYVGNDILRETFRLINLKNFSKIFIITDFIVAKKYLSKVKEILPSNNREIAIKSGEEMKDIETVKMIWKNLLNFGCDRKSLIINLGGGVIGDLGGFVASTFMRGIKFIQIPTTLLSQVDSSVGGKVGINFGGVKNLIGSFNEPIAVICDTNFLSTLPDKVFNEGFAEIIKHGIIYDRNYFKLVTSKKPREFSQKELVEIISGSVKIKAEVVTYDEKEEGIRRLLNFGHTFGHTIEALGLKGEKPLHHGEAISIGMVLEAKISQILGLISEIDFERIKKALNNADLPINALNFPYQKMINKIKHDKKNEGGEIKWTLIKEIGQAVINKSVSEDVILKAYENH